LKEKQDTNQSYDDQNWKSNIWQIKRPMCSLQQQKQI